MVVYSDSERLEFDEYIEFLKRSDLGSQYPKQNFETRIKVLLKNADICVTARTSAGLLVGIAFAITDWAYFLFLTDLAVDRDFANQGIGKELLTKAHQKAGGEGNITITTISNDKAIGFYEKCGMHTQPNLVVKYCRDWESFVVE
jgi:ribosomal protein S18 acetylase RimI-like enzyme